MPSTRGCGGPLPFLMEPILCCREILSNGKDEGEFWDAVLITAADDGQAGIFRDQLSSRLELGYLPTSTQYHVISDPPGPKIGNGGATLVALDWLRSRFGDAVRAMKILLIHAGGYSQRTPNHSVCGKIFAPLPVGPVAGTTMLEMCLAMLCDIPRRARSSSLFSSDLFSLIGGWWLTDIARTFHPQPGDHGQVWG